MNQQTTTYQKPRPAVMDVSLRALDIARIIDRLSPGTYTLEVIKDPILSVDWKVTVNRQNLVQRVSLSKSYTPE